MARLTVGNIELDSGHSSGMTASPSHGVSPQLKAFVAKLPMPAWLLLTVGSAALIGGIGWLVMGLTAATPVFPVFAPLIASLGGGLSVLGGIKLAQGGPSQTPASGSATVEAARRVRIIEALKKVDAPATIEDLIAATGFMEKVVLDTLMTMKEEQLVTEDLDLNTGEWKYVLSDSSGGRKHLSLEDRRAQLKSGAQAGSLTNLH